MLADTLAQALTYAEFQNKTLGEYASEHEYDIAAAEKAWQECKNSFKEIEQNEYLITKLAKYLK